MSSFQSSTFKSSWQNALPEDEIGRQQAMKERLAPGTHVILRFDGVELGEFIYSGVWDTMHSFYPAPENALIPETIAQLLPDNRKRYARRDLRGREYLQLPYTLLADAIVVI